MHGPDDTREFCRIERLTPEQANQKTRELMAWIDLNQKHLDLRDQIIYWRNAFWDLIHNRKYGPNSQLIRQIEELRELNQKQAGRIMELEFDNRCLRRVHDTKVRGD